MTSAKHRHEYAQCVSNQIKIIGSTEEESPDGTAPSDDTEPVAGPSRPAEETAEAPVQSLPDLSDAVEDDAWSGEAVLDPTTLPRDARGRFL